MCLHTFSVVYQEPEYDHSVPEPHQSLTLTGFFTEVKSALLFFSSYSAQDDKAYDLTLSSLGKIPVYCHMSDSGLGECGGGGWTLVMKIDGTKVRLGIASRPSFPCLQFLSGCFFFRWIFLYLS